MDFACPVANIPDPSASAHATATLTLVLWIQADFRRARAILSCPDRALPRRTAVLRLLQLDQRLREQERAAAFRRVLDPLERPVEASPVSPESQETTA